MIKNIDLGDGRTLIITDVIEFKAEDTYKVTYYENGRQIMPTEYYSAEAIELDWGVTV